MKSLAPGEEQPQAPENTVCSPALCRAAKEALAGCLGRQEVDHEPAKYCLGESGQQCAVRASPAV